MAESAFPKTRAFLWKRGKLRLLDQRLLPHRQVWRECWRWAQVAKGIRDMVIRGAPAIGCAAAYGLALASRERRFRTLEAQNAYLDRAFDGLLQARPTAVNLRWALERMRQTYAGLPKEKVRETAALLEQEAIRIEAEDRESNRRIGELGAALFEPDAVVMTHCNTGSLATAGLGTAFGVLWTAHRGRRIRKVVACETRPYFQGARLTAWELQQEGIPFELITDSMAAHFMKTEKIDGIIVGADRIAANGDTANKIGTYSLAVLAAYHEIPFYVAAPFSSVDLGTANGSAIPIEERSVEEVTRFGGRWIAPTRTVARHPAFDVTPSDLISAIITDKGVARPPYSDNLRTLTEGQPALN